MKVLLVDVDSREDRVTGEKFPNLALMKLSAYHKARRDKVGFNVGDPDLVLVSCIFRANRFISGVSKMYPDAEVRYGGPGYSLKNRLPDEIDRLKPDYDLYPYIDFSMGFTTRGCIRHCYFCIVPEKEGKLVRVQHPREFHDPKFKKIMVMDNNWLADKDWFMETSQWILDNKLRLWENGMDIRLLDQEVAERLKALKWAKRLHFAFDSDNDASAVESGIHLLNRVGINVRHNVRTYVYLHDNSEKNIESAIWRCRFLKGLNTTPLVMFNIEKKPNQRVQRIRRWTGKPWIFWTTDIDDYNRKLADKKEER